VTDQERKLIRDHERQRALLWVVGTGVVIMLIVTTALSSAAIVIASNVRANTKQIARNSAQVGRNSAKLRAVEKRDRTALRGASYRTCEREQRDRAEQHLRASLSPPAAIAKLVRQLGLPSHLAKQVSIEAVRKRLPIFDCTPNLVGQQARPLSAAEQRKYVHRYAAGQLDSTP
jgi:hypothetical protein